MKKFRLSDHIMPRRIVRYFPWLAAQSIIWYVVFKITAVVWRSVMIALKQINFHLQWVIVFSLVVLTASFLTFWEAVRLARDSTVRMDFMASISDGSYDTKKDMHLILHSDEPWNDTAIVSVLYLLLYIYRLFRFWYMDMINPDLTLAQVNTHILEIGIVNFICLLLFIVFYAVTHIMFTVMVHRRWSEDRMRTTETPAAEKKAYM